MSEQAQPVRVTFDDVSTAQSRIRGSVPQTPCEYSKMSDALGMEVYFKKNYLLPTGSFKERGVRNALEMLSDDQKRKGVIAASDGNHAFALSYHGQQLGIPVTIVMPENAPINKIASCEKYGATVHEQGTDLLDSENFALKKAATNELQYINRCDDPSIIAGAGTMGLEIIQQVKDVDAVIIPVGGGGLIAGVAVAVKELSPKTLVIGVESERCASFTAAMNGEPVKIGVNQAITLAPGLCVSKDSINAFHTAEPHIDRMITVHEDYIALAVLRLLEEEKVTIEGAGAVGLAVCLTEQVPELKEKKVVIALCGRNIDSIVLGRCLDRGLAADGRLVRFVVTVSDRPGAIADVTQLVASVGADVKDIFYERAWWLSSAFSVQFKIVARVRDRNHGKKLKEALISNYSKEEVNWPSFDNGSGEGEYLRYQSDKRDNDVDIAAKPSEKVPNTNNDVDFTAELSRKRPKLQSQEWKYIGESAKHKKMFSEMIKHWPKAREGKKSGRCACDFLKRVLHWQRKRWKPCFSWTEKGWLRQGSETNISR
ncbi:L-threonine ammonia-lyase-like [Xenia sp. Carnegie-2017]|uniref:L-threonine ammonia-lyase-like n=1 Tax=Xenia sp. Carnegie-2017 TaxID=2897299 RepID=UPI001F04A2F8|nr:L-threonine ammonia-lyase-like [Xenia sp. Carnegie-2017]